MWHVAGFAMPARSTLPESSRRRISLSSGCNAVCEFPRAPDLAAGVSEALAVALHKRDSPRRTRDTTGPLHNARRLPWARPQQFHCPIQGNTNFISRFRAIRLWDRIREKTWMRRKPARSGKCWSPTEIRRPTRANRLESALSYPRGRYRPHGYSSTGEDPVTAIWSPRSGS